MAVGRLGSCQSGIIQGWQILMKKSKRTQAVLTLFDQMDFLSAQQQPKLLPPDAFTGLIIYGKCVCGRDSAGGAYSALPGPLAEFKGPLRSRGGRERKGKKRGNEGEGQGWERGREGKRKGREEDGRGKGEGLRHGCWGWTPLKMALQMFKKSDVSD